MKSKREAVLRPPLPRVRKTTEPKRKPALKKDKDVRASGSRALTMDKGGLKEELLTKKDQYAPVFHLMDVDLWEPSSSLKKNQARGVSVSSSSSQTTEVPRRARMRRRKRMSPDLVDGVMERTNFSLLEEKAVGEQTHKIYKEELSNFLSFARPLGLDVEKAESLDRMAVDYMNRLYVQGFQVYKADRLAAAILHFYPAFGRMGSLKLPRMWRALKGYRKLCPGKSRLAYPLPIWAAVANRMREMGQLRMAVFVMVAVSSYARPSELLRMRVFSLVRPSAGITSSWSLLLSPEDLPERSKTGDFDVSIALDSPFLRAWSDPVFNQLKKSHPEDPLWDFDYNEYSRAFKKVTEHLGIDNLTPYQTRHSGPSIDRAKGYRTQLEVMKRGQWKSQSSVARYEKAARLAATFNSLPMELQSHARLCEEELGGIMLGTRKPIAFGGSQK